MTARYVLDTNVLVYARTQGPRAGWGRGAPALGHQRSCRPAGALRFASICWLEQAGPDPLAVQGRAPPYSPFGSAAHRLMVLEGPTSNPENTCSPITTPDLGRRPPGQVGVVSEVA